MKTNFLFDTKKGSCIFTSVGSGSIDEGPTTCFFRRVGSHPVVGKFFPPSYCPHLPVGPTTVPGLEPEDLAADSTTDPVPGSDSTSRLEVKG